MIGQSGNRILAIGATSRNSGKTEFICRLISRFKLKGIIAVKIKTIYPHDHQWHGRGRDFTEDFTISQEPLIDGKADSHRYYNAGAELVYYVKSKSEHLDSALKQLLKMIPINKPIIIESNSLLAVIKPSVFIMIKGSSPDLYKPSSLAHMDQADLIIQTNGQIFSTKPQELNIFWENGTWNLT